MMTASTISSLIPSTSIFFISAKSEESSNSIDSWRPGDGGGVASSYLTGPTGEGFEGFEKVTEGVETLSLCDRLTFLFGCDWLFDDDEDVDDDKADLGDMALVVLLLADAVALCVDRGFDDGM
jgi:hypothetical protein